MTRFKHALVLLMLLLPTLVFLMAFSHYPSIYTTAMSLFRWTPFEDKAFIGLDNYFELFSSNTFWKSIELILVLTVANFVKLWPGAIAALALHRLHSENLRERLQYAFVLPLIIPAIVWILVWDSFFEAENGLLNQALIALGIMPALERLDVAMPVLHEVLRETLFLPFINPVFGGLHGFSLLGFLILFLSSNRQERFSTRAYFFGTLFSISAILIIVLRVLQSGGEVPFLGIGVALILLISLIMFASRFESSNWKLWTFLAFLMTLVFRQTPFHLLFILILSFCIVELIRWRMAVYRVKGTIQFVSGLIIGLAFLFYLLGGIWTEPTGQFTNGNPAWLSNPHLIRPALVIWGFPWVNVVSVIIILAGLQQIPKEVYESARLEGVRTWDVITRIEIPMVFTQLRIILVFLTIASLTQYELFLVLFGADGGAGNQGLVPGLYLFHEAFVNMRFGYASAIGVVVFFLILALTVVYHRYLRVNR